MLVEPVPILCLFAVTDAHLELRNELHQQHCGLRCVLDQRHGI